MIASLRRIYLAIGVVATLVCAGTAGYMLIERMSFLDALYMTAITITTVGYEEVQPLDSSGRIFTIILIFTGVGAAFYLLGAVTESVVGGQLRELLGRSSMNRKINQLEGHVVLCGYGRFGRIVAEELRRNDMTTVVIESNPRKEVELARDDQLFIIGSAVEDQVLALAGVERAADIVIATASDPDNVYISLSARNRNPRIRIHARAESESGLRHLNLAGVDRAISSYQWSALRIANAITHPSIVDFLNLILPGRREDERDEEISLEEVTLPPRSGLLGSTIAEVEGHYARLRGVVIRRGAGKIRVIAPPELELQGGDLLVVIGARTSLKSLAATIES